MLYFFRELLQTLKAIQASLWKLVQTPSFSIKLKGELMADMLTYELGLNPVGVDVESQKVTVIADDVMVFHGVLDKDTAMVEFTVEQDSAVSVSLVYIDDAGNESNPATMDFVAVDTLAPDAPAGFGELRLVSETETIPEPEVVPDPTDEDTVV